MIDFHLEVIGPDLRGRGTCYRHCLSEVIESEKAWENRRCQNVGVSSRRICAWENETKGPWNYSSLFV